MVIWRPDFSGPRVVLLDQPGDDRDVAEGAAQHRALRHPFLQLVAQDVLLEQRARRRVGSKARPDGQHVVGREIAERRHAEALHPLRHQHAQRLVREPALEAIGDEEPACRRAGRSRPAARPRGGSARAHGAAAAAIPAPASGRCLQRLRVVRGSRARARRGRSSAACGCRHRPARAARPRRRGETTAASGLQPLEAQQLAGEDEAVAGHRGWRRTIPPPRPAPAPPRSRTFSIGVSTMVPRFMRSCRATRWSRTCTQPLGIAEQAGGSAHRPRSA